MVAIDLLDSSDAAYSRRRYLIQYPLKIQDIFLTFISRYNYSEACTISVMK